MSDSSATHAQIFGNWEGHNYSSVETIKVGIKILLIQGKHKVTEQSGAKFLIMIDDWGWSIVI